MSADLDGRIVVFSVHSRVQVMVDGGKDYIVSNQHTIPNLYPALILEVTAGVDKHLPKFMGHNESSAKRKTHSSECLHK